jgi:NADPH-dependent 2,4-dienoyl-CoA reductase/sulfur reductase-like enzyme
MARFRGSWETGERRNFKRILVVGAGRAGVATAEELRRQGFGGEVMVMCDEPDAPYDRPSCSKGLLNGQKRPRDAKMPVQDDLAISWVMGRQAMHLDPANRVLFTDTDEKFPYDGLVIATGARPIWPKGWPREPGLHQLHGLRDAWSLRQALRRAKRVAIVGGGLTGCEVACTVRSLAREAVLIDSKHQVMTRPLGEVVGRYITEEVERDGVELRLGRRVSRVDRGRRGWKLTLDDGSDVEADLVVATIGERPDTRWLESTGFDISDGVLCDENLRVVGAEDVVAAGTVARWPNLRYSTEPKRVGQWIMALEQGRAAAAALLRSDHPTRPAALVPRYWSEQFGLRIQVCGEVQADGGAEMTVSRQRPGRKDTAKAGVLIGYHRNGEQIGVVGVNAVRAFTTTARMMLANPAKLVDQESYGGPPMLAAAPASAPSHRAPEPVHGTPEPVVYETPEPVYAAPAGPPPMPREQIVVDARAAAYDYAPPQPYALPPQYGYESQPPPYGAQPPPDRYYYGPPPPSSVPAQVPYDYAQPGYAYGYDPAYGYPPPQYGYGQPPPPPVPAPPVSAPARPVSSIPRSPRDRFSTDEFAAVR